MDRLLNLSPTLIFLQLRNERGQPAPGENRTEDRLPSVHAHPALSLWPLRPGTPGRHRDSTRATCRLPEDAGPP